jgi:hypothetical protein
VSTKKAKSVSLIVLKINTLVSRYLTFRVRKLNNNNKVNKFMDGKYQEHICKMIYTICSSSCELSIFVFLLLIVKVWQSVP